MTELVESRCGILCSKCEYIAQCGGGCTKITKPFWGDSCPVKDCCEGRNHNHCGECHKFPCELLTQFAYDIDQGDNGKRIETCRHWAGMPKVEATPFNLGQFIQAVVKQNADDLRSFFTPEAIICWHDSNEELTLDEYIRANCEYPGEWEGEIQRVDKIEGGLVLVTKISSSESAHYVTAFVKLTGDRISRLDEYYSDCNEAPEWRKEMKIGKKIRS